MRLPAFLTSVSPVGETLAAVEQGRCLLESEAEKRNRQLSVTTAEDGLTLWEADYSLPGGSGARVEDRRASVRAALSGGQTLTRDRLKALCASIGGADDAELEENFSDWHVRVTALYEGKLPEDMATLEKVVQRLKPAHLRLDMAAEGRLRFEDEQYRALSGSAFLVVTGQEGA